MIFNSIVNSESTGRIVGTLTGSVTAVINVFNNSFITSATEIISCILFALVGGMAGWLGTHIIKTIWNSLNKKKKK